MIDTPGLYQIPESEYHADPTPAPSLSASIAKVLLGQSPRHAAFQHPKLNPGYEYEAKESFDLGTACHAYILEGEANFEIINAKDWRTKEAQSARDVARMVGRTPLLERQWLDVQAMATVLREPLGHFRERPIPLTNGQPEQTLIWREGTVWCRGRPDWLHSDHRTIDDLKSTQGSAHPDAWARAALFGLGYDIQAAFYLRGLKAVTGKDANFRFVVVEIEPPFGCSVIGVAPDVLELADKKVDRALTLWAECLERGAWPGYPLWTCYPALPAWEATRWLEHESEPARGIIDDGRPIGDLLS